MGAKGERERKSEGGRVKAIGLGRSMINPICVDYMSFISVCRAESCY
jgi:hypothetical protein